MSFLGYYLYFIYYFTELEIKVTKYFVGLKKEKK